VTIAELIAELEKYPPDLPVVTYVGPDGDPFDVQHVEIRHVHAEYSLWTDGKADTDVKVLAI